MTSFHDAYPDLPLLVDVGGERYYLGPNKPVELAYKGRAEFVRAFPARKGARFTPEYLVRSHMAPTADGRSFQFRYPGEKEALIALLEQRIQQLKGSREFTGSVLKHAMLQRVSLQLQEILATLRGTKEKKEGDVGNAGDTGDAGDAAKKEALAPIPSLSEDQLLSLLLELVWYLLHPEMVPTTLQSEWSTMLKELDTLRLGDIMAQIRTLQQAKGMNPAIRPRNFFDNKGVHVRTGNKTGGSSENALDKVIEFSTHIDNTVAREDAEKRVKALLHILQAKKYLQNRFQFDESLLNVMDISNALPSVQKSLLRNVVQDDKSKRLDRPLTSAMVPLFDYFATMFDPVYGFLHEGIAAYLNKIDYVARPRLIPRLLTLLHVCQGIHPTKETDGVNLATPMYGVYELTDADPELLAFIRALLIHTRGKVAQMGDDDDAKDYFQKQLTSLPNVRLSFASRRRGLLPNATDESAAVPYISLVMVGENLTVPSLDNYMRERKLTESLHEDIADFFQPDRLYLTIAKSESDDVPVNLHRIDMREVTVETDPIPIKRQVLQDPNDITLLKNKELLLGNLVETNPYVVCTNAEILLSLLIAFQERIPK